MSSKFVYGTGTQVDMHLDQRERPLSVIDLRQVGSEHQEVTKSLFRPETPVTSSEASVTLGLRLTVTYGSFLSRQLVHSLVLY